jgi:hypothetical protein
MTSNNYFVTARFLPEPLDERQWTTTYTSAASSIYPESLSENDIVGTGSLTTTEL